jgi:hypothetical protein
MIMKKKLVRSLVNARRRKMAIGVAAVLSVFGCVGTALAATTDTRDLLNILSSAVADVKTKFDEISGAFTNGVKDISVISDPSTILGDKKIFDPNEREKTDTDPDPNNTLANRSQQATLAQATADLAAKRGLSKEAQKAAQETQLKIEELNSETAQVADEVFNDADVIIPSLDSTQDVLKQMSYQLSGIADISAAQVRLATLQSNNFQEMTTQMAALNLANSATLAQMRSKQQSESLKKDLAASGTSAAAFSLLTDY